MRAKASVWTPHNANFMHDSSSGHICTPPSFLWFPLFLAYVYNLWQRCRDWVIFKKKIIVRYKNSFFPHSRKESLPFSHKQISFRKMIELFILINNEVECKSSTNLRISLWTEGTVYDELCWYMNSCLWLQAWLSAARFPPTPLPHNTIWFLLVYLFTCLFSSHTVASVGIGKSFLFNFIHWFKTKTKHKNTDSFPVMQSCQCLFNTVVLRNLQKYRHNYDLNKAMSD